MISGERRHGAPRDPARINVQNEWEIQWWCMRFSTTPDALRAAVREVGTSAEDVKHRLWEAGPEPFKPGAED